MAERDLDSGRSQNRAHSAFPTKAWLKNVQICQNAQKKIDNVKRIRYVAENFGTKGDNDIGKKAWAIFFILVFFCLSVSGCYYFAGQNEMKAAENSLSELRGAAGQVFLPDQYCCAEIYLEIAKLEAAESDWKAARNFATRSKSAAGTGLSEIKKDNRIKEG